MPRVVLRSAYTGVSDTAYPSGAGQTNSVDLAPYRDVRGPLKCHALVDADFTDANGTVIVTLYGYNTDAGEWYVIHQLNRGATITRDTNTPVREATNNLHYSERLVDVTGLDRLYALLTSIAGAGSTITVAVLIEH